MFLVVALVFIVSIFNITDVSAATKKTPAKPKISVKISDDKIKLTIKKTKNAEGYEIYIKNPNGSGFEKAAIIKKNGKAARSYTFIDMAEGEYSIKVRAYSGNVYSKYSATKKAIVKSMYDFSDAVQGDVIKFGRFEQDNEKKNGKEQIEWVVLSKNKKGLLLISKYILDNRPFHDIDEGTVWEKSTLRTWLNKDFYKVAFNDTEKAMIQKQSISNEYNDSKTLGGKNTKDNVFLLTVNDTNNISYGFNENEYYDSTARASATKYALAKGLEAYSSSDNENYGTLDGDPSSSWWLRDPGLTGVRGTIIDFQGEIQTRIPYTGTDIGVRPVIFINFKSE